MTAPLSVSVILPVYNGALFVRSAFASVIAQSVPPLEVILVDDGSLDDSASVLEELAASSAIRTTVITHENCGQSASRNAAAAVAEGELLAFLDQDDLWHRRHLELLTAPFGGDPELGWSYSDFDEIDREGLVTTRDVMRVIGADGPRASVIDIIRGDAMVLPSASVIRARAFGDVGGFDPRLRGYEDDDLFLRIFRAGWTSTFVAESLTSFRVHPNSSSTRGIFRASRMIYFSKVAAALPDEVRMNRYYVSDLLRPRMVSSTLFEYSVALSLHHDDEAREIATDLRALLHTARPGRRRRLSLAILSRPRLARMLLRLYARTPLPFRPKVPPILTRGV